LTYLIVLENSFSGGLHSSLDPILSTAGRNFIASFVDAHAAGDGLKYGLARKAPESGLHEVVRSRTSAASKGLRGLMGGIPLLGLIEMPQK
jgi:hypothetical protein